MPPEGLLDEALRAAAARAPDSVAIRDVVLGGERERTYAALERDVAAVAGGLARLGLGSGDRAALLARNRAEYVVCVLALARIGAVAVPLSWRLGPRELAWIVADSTAKVVLAERAFADALAGVDGPAKVALDGAPPAGWSPFFELAGGAPRERASERSDDDALLQLYTSGTTGTPKGAVLSAANVRAFARTWIRETDLSSPDDRVFVGSPLFHVGGLVMTLCTLLAGARVVLRPEFEPGEALDGLAGERATHALFVPAMLRWMLAERGVRERSFPALRRIVYGASPIPPELLGDALEVFGCGFVQGYGLTETTGALTVLRPEDHADDMARLASAGRCLDCCEIRVVDERGGDVPTGAIGEVVARGSNVFAGYWRRPDANAEAFAGGWFATGDLGRLDADGYLTLVDRKKDMLVVGGENVYPREVELALAEHALVQEACVIGVPHDVWGEEVLALVVARPGAELPRAFDRVLIAHCRDRLATFKCPTKVELVDALPRNAAGKVDKRALREPRWRHRSRPI